MPVSCCSVDGTRKFFSESAGYYARKFRRKGLDSSQRLITAGLESLGLKGRTVLEIGCGVGALHLSLLNKGAASAVGVEVSEGMIDKAKELASEMGLSSRVEYRVGDFARMNGSVPRCDIVILDKVFCCYVEPAALAAASGDRCGRLLAVSYPRAALLPRLVYTCSTMIGRALHREFYPLYHEPSDLDGYVEAQGFREVSRAQTVIWQIKIFEREKASAHPR